MANTDRIINHEDALGILAAINRIKDNQSKQIAAPVLTKTKFDYTGETINIMDYLVGFDSNEMLIYGDLSETEQGVYSFTIVLKNMNNSFMNEGKNKKIYFWYLGESESELSWAKASDAMIYKLVNMSDTLPDFNLTDVAGWTVGDSREITFPAISSGSYNPAWSSQKIHLILMDTDHYTLTTPTENGKTKSSFVVGFEHSLNPGFGVESSNTNANGWKNSRGRKTVSIILNNLPNGIKNSAKEFQIWTADKGGNNSNSSSYISDKIALFAEKEIFGSKTYSIDSEANALSQIEYYKNAANRIKKLGETGSAYHWWLRSPHYDSATTFCLVDTGGDAFYYSANGALGFSPFCCI